MRRQLPAQADDTQPKKSSTLWIIGACAVVAGMVVISVGSDDADDNADDDPGVTLRRASDATLEDCDADWNAPIDCESVPADNISNKQCMNSLMRRGNPTGAT